MEEVYEFKYFGSILYNHGSMDVEMREGVVSGTKEESGWISRASNEKGW